MANKIMKTIVTLTVNQIISRVSNLETVSIDTVSISYIIGKKVKTFTQGYEDQSYSDEFIVGCIKPRYTTFNASYLEGKDLSELEKKYGYSIFTSDGRDTCIFASDDTDGVFCCSDSDRWTEFEIMD